MDCAVAYLIAGFLTFCCAGWYLKRKEEHGIEDKFDYFLLVLLQSFWIAAFWPFVVPYFFINHILDKVIDGKNFL